MFNFLYNHSEEEVKLMKVGRLNTVNLQVKCTTTDNIKTNVQSDRPDPESEVEHWPTCGVGKLFEQIPGAQLQESDLVPCPQ